MMTTKDKIQAVEQFAERVVEVEGRSLWQDARRRFFKPCRCHQLNYFDHDCRDCFIGSIFQPMEL